MTGAIHIEGMGVIGSVLAWTLTERGVPFTWHDAELAICAWPACTGSVVPSTDLSDQKGYTAWARWATDPPWSVAAPIIEPADYWRTVGHALQRQAQLSYHVNAPALVSVTRDAFREQRRSGAPTDTRVVIAHGYSERLDHLVWGWSCLVDLSIATTAPGSQRRPCVYVQRNRYQVAYAYPCPGTPYWFAGSSHIAQRPRLARELEVAPKYHTWQRLLLANADGLVVRAHRVSPFVQGWRPVPRANDQGWVQRTNGRLVTRPCGSSGVRWAPLIAALVCERLGLEVGHD